MNAADTVAARANMTILLNPDPIQLVSKTTEVRAALSHVKLLSNNPLGQTLLGIETTPPS